MTPDIRKMPWFHAAYWLCLYLAMGALSGQFNVNSTARAPYVWLPAGVSLAAMLLSHTRSSTPLAIAFSLLQSVLSHLGGRDIPSSLVLGILAGVAPLVAATVIRRMRVPLEGLHLLKAVVVAALVSAVLLGGGGALYFSVTKAMPFAKPLLEWSAAIFVGVCITLPLLTVWAQFRPSLSAQSDLLRDLVGYAAFAAMAGLTWALFDSATERWLDAIGATSPLYLPMFFVVIVAIASGARGGTLAVLALTVICLGRTARGEGPFGSQAAPAWLPLLQAQLYVGVSALLVLIVHALRDAEAKAYAQADRWRTDLELALAGGALIAYMVDPSTQSVQWRGDVQRLIGYPAESLSTVDDVLARIHRLDREHLRAHWSSSSAQSAPAPARLPLRLSSALASGEWIELVDAGSPLSDGNGRVALVAGVWQCQPPRAR
jgi:PAS domain-containing protein